MAERNQAQNRLAHLTDEELLGLITRGDREALSALYDRYARQVYSLALRMAENQGLAEEVAQDVFMTVWARGATYRSERGPFSAWILSIAHNRCIDELRKRRRRSKIPTTDIDELHADPATGPDEVTDAVFTSMDRQTLVKAMGHLPPPQRQVILMAYFQGLTQSEISNALATPLGTVKTRMRLGLQKMRDILAAQGTLE